MKLVLTGCSLKLNHLKLNKAVFFSSQMQAWISLFLADIFAIKVSKIFDSEKMNQPNVLYGIIFENTQKVSFKYIKSLKIPMSWKALSFIPD